MTHTISLNTYHTPIGWLGFQSVCLRCAKLTGRGTDWVLMM